MFPPKASEDVNDLIDQTVLLGLLHNEVALHVLLDFFDRLLAVVQPALAQGGLG